MNIDFLKRLLWFAVFDSGTGVLYSITFICLLLPHHCFISILSFCSLVNYPQWAMLIWAFLMGLTIDTFSNTPGVASASLTLIAALQPYVLQLFIPRDSSDNFQAGMDTLSIPQYYVGMQLF